VSVARIDEQFAEARVDSTILAGNTRTQNDSQDGRASCKHR